MVVARKALRMEGVSEAWEAGDPHGVRRRAKVTHLQHHRVVGMQLPTA